MLIECLTGEAERGAWRAHRHCPLPHGGLGTTELRGGHPERPPAIATAGPGRGEAGASPFGARFALEGGKCGEDLRRHLPYRAVVSTGTL